MMKKLSMLMLVLTLVLALSACGCDHVWIAATCDTPQTCQECGETEGEPKGHSMVEATCEEAKHCENCDLTEGEALGHIWLDATTEAPKTCETCAATEGERIITDPRFTTAATADLQGQWCMKVPIGGVLMGIPDFPEGATMDVLINFSNSGEMVVVTTASDNYIELLIQYTVDTMYSEFEAEGMDKETADTVFAEATGMSIQEFAESMADDEMINAAIAANEVSGVYYMQDGQLYTGYSWEDELTAEDFTLDGDTMTLSSFEEVYGDAYKFVRVVE